jgi:4'-phosphopantetheinyl transferase
MTLLPSASGVRVVAAQLDVTPTRLRALAATLSGGERERACRIEAGATRRRFVAARGLLRELLGALLGEAPGTVRLEYGQHGKPYMRGPLRFSVAHSGDLVLLAVACGREVGVDVELVRRLQDYEGVARAVLALEEQDALAALAEDDREAALLRAWTCKEAYLKACGDGLQFPPQSVVVSLGASEPPSLLAVRERPADADRFSLRTLAPAPGYVGALALERRA